MELCIGALVHLGLVHWCCGIRIGALVNWCIDALMHHYKVHWHGTLMYQCMNSYLSTHASVH